MQLPCCHTAARVVHREYELNSKEDPGPAGLEDKPALDAFVFCNELYISELVHKVNPRVLFTVSAALTFFLTVIIAVLFPIASTLARVGLVLHASALTLFLSFGTYFVKMSPFTMSASTASRLLSASVVLSTIAGCLYFASFSIYDQHPCADDESKCRLYDSGYVDSGFYLMFTIIMVAQTLFNFQHYYSLLLCWTLILTVLVLFQVENGVNHSWTDIFIFVCLSFCSMVHCNTRKETFINAQEKLQSDKDALRLKGEAQLMELHLSDMR